MDAVFAARQGQQHDQQKNTTHDLNSMRSCRHGCL
jgi:hypothetical protein